MTKNYFQFQSDFVIETLLISDTDFQVNKKMYVSGRLSGSVG